MIRLQKRALAVVLCVAACSHSHGPLEIGLAGPLSEPRGIAMQRGAELARDQINARGGVGGRPLQLDFADDSASPDVAARVAQAFVDDPRALAVVGHLTSAASLVAAQIYGAAAHPMVMLAPAASSPDLSALSPYVFRLCPTDSSYGAALARFARRTLGARRAAVIFLSNPYGRGLRNAFMAEFGQLGGTVIEADPYVPAILSLEPYLLRMRRASPDVVVLATERSGAELALRQMRSLGMRPGVLGGDALAGIEETGSLAEGLHVSTAYLPDQPSELNAAFVAAYSRAYPGARPDARAAAAYDAVILLARALAAAGPDRAAVRGYLAALGHGVPEMAGVTGPIEFDSAGNIRGKAALVGVVRNGRLVPEVAP